MSDGGNLNFCDQFGQCNAEGKMQWNGQRVLGDQNIDVKFIDEFCKLNFDYGLECVYGFSNRRFPSRAAENPIVYPLVLLVLEMGLRDQETPIGVPIQFSGKPETGVTAVFKNFSPFTGFKGDAVDAGKTG